MTTKYPIYIVKWLDAIVDVEEREPGKPLKPHPFSTIGYLTHKDKDFVNLAQDIEEDGSGNFRGVTCIPIGMILSMKRLSSPRK